MPIFPIMRITRSGEVSFPKNYRSMRNNGITDVFFDLDHTLWDFDRNSALAFGRVFQKHKIQMEVSDFVREYEPINLHYWKQFREEKITREELRRGRLVETFRFFKIELPMASIDFLANSYLEELPMDNHLLSGTVEILDYLFPKYGLHIITNGFGKVQHRKLSNSKIDKFFSTITTSEEVGVKKPNPVIFETALRKASVPPSCSIMIGDSLEADIEGAKRVGMRTLFFNYTSENIDHGCEAINELLQIKHHL